MFYEGKRGITEARIQLGGSFSCLQDVEVSMVGLTGRNENCHFSNGRLVMYMVLATKPCSGKIHDFLLRDL